MKKNLFSTLLCVALAGIFCVLLASCSAREVVRAGRIAATGDVQGATTWAAEKGVSYTLNPKQLENDIKRIAARIESFRKAVKGIWGKDDVKEPTPKQYVKYTQNYLSRAEVDFDKGLIIVETVDSVNPQQSLKNAIVTTLLAPHDPRGLDLWTDNEIKLGETPFLLGEVKDYDGQSMRWAWRAERFADLLVRRKRAMRQIVTGDERKTVHFVTIPMVKDHVQVRALKYKPFVDVFARKFSVSPNLVYAVIKTESDFNPWAISAANAYGLMQVVPKTAGADVYKFLHNKAGAPAPETLYDPETNIQYGTAYLHMLFNKYLVRVEHPISREYCVIAAYNGGAGNVLKSFHADKNEAVNVINSLTPHEVYERMQRRLPYQETRRYLYKVVNARKSFVYLQ